LDDIEDLQERMASVLIGICTEDFSELLDLTSLLNAKGVRYLILGPGERVAAHLDCLIIHKGTGLPLLFGGPAPLVTMDRDPLVTIDRALAASWGLERASMLIIGVDPGSRPGVAYLLDGRLVAVHRSSSTEDLLQNVLARKRAYRTRRTLVKVGNGDPGSRDRIVKGLRGAKLQMTVVDERCTSLSKRRRDEMAAIRIARIGC
jgi:hypothetical protein